MTESYTHFRNCGAAILNGDYTRAEQHLTKAKATDDGTLRELIREQEENLMVLKRLDTEEGAQSR